MITLISFIHELKNSLLHVLSINKIDYVIFIIFSVIIFNYNLVFSKTDDELFQDGLSLRDQKKYNEAFNIFNDLCINKKHINSCLFLGMCYTDERFVNNINKDYAIELFKYVYANSDNELAIETAKWQIALTLDTYADDDDDVNEAMGIYNTLLSSTNEIIAESSNERLNFKSTYKFMTEFLNLLIKFTHKEITYKELDYEISKLNIYDLPDNSRDIFLKLRQPLLEVVRFDQSRRDNRSAYLMKSIINFATEDVAGSLSSVYDLYKENKEMEKIAQDVTNLLIQLLKQLSHDGLSVTWLKNKAKMLNS